jgi:hypothetical protein
MSKFKETYKRREKLKIATKKKKNLNCRKPKSFLG